MKRHTFRTLADLYDYSTSKFAKRTFAEFVDGSQSYTYAQFKETCDNLSRALSTFGIGTGDKVAILSENMPHWTIAYFAIAAFGRIVVPMLEGVSPSEVENILSHSESKAIFVSKKQLPKISQERIDQMKLVIDIDDFSLIKADGEAYTCDGRVGAPTPLDIAAIIYTSGTSGNAKGVMLSHSNLCVNILSSWQAYKARKHHVFLSILPMAHTYEMSIGLLYPFACGSKVCYLQKPPTPSVLIPALKTVRPHVMLSVPLVIEKVYKSSVVPTVKKSKTLSWMKDHAEWLLDWLVGFKLRKTFGGRMGFFGIGGAKLDSTVETFLKKAGFPYAIGYGMTECAPLICTANPSQTKVGSTGRPVKCMQLKLENVNPETGQGEIVVKGPNVMLGYYKDYERTRQVLSTDGWFHTGDLACIDKKGKVSIKGRLGSMILSASGENIYPEEIETVINGIDGVSESLVVEREGQLVALVRLNDNVLDWDFESEEKFLKNLEEKKKSITDFVNSHVSKFSQIKKVEIQREPFVKTATQKIRRFIYTDKKKVKQ